MNDPSQDTEFGVMGISANAMWADMLYMFCGILAMDSAGVQMAVAAVSPQ